MPATSWLTASPRRRAQYSPDLFVREGLDFLSRHRDERFFLYLTFTIPHANNEAGKQGMETPDDAPYTNEAWPQPQKNHAAMITRLDQDVGRVLDRLAELKLDENTIVFFSSDNGPHKEGRGRSQVLRERRPVAWAQTRFVRRGNSRAVFSALARPRGKWHQRPALRVSGTCCRRWPSSGAFRRRPALMDSRSCRHSWVRSRPAASSRGMNTFTGSFTRGGSSKRFAPRTGKRFVSGRDGKLELHDLASDVGEKHDVAADHPDVVARLTNYLDTARTDSRDWPLPEARPAGEMSRSSVLLAPFLLAL